MALLEVKNASYGYQATKVFENVNLTVAAGEILTIIGPNGIGKSTLLKCLVNLLTLDAGEVLIDDRLQSKIPQRELAQLVGYIPQLNNQVYNYFVRDYIVMGRAARIGYLQKPSEKDYALADEALQRLNLMHLAQRSYNELSGGEQQRVNLARVLAQKPKLIVLDEPTSALDLGNQMLVLQVIQQLAKAGFGIIMTTHDPNQAFRLNSAVGLADGQKNFRFGTADELLTSENLSQTFQTPIVVTQTVLDEQKICLPTLKLST